MLLLRVYLKGRYIGCYVAVFLEGSFAPFELVNVGYFDARYASRRLFGSVSDGWQGEGCL